MLGMEYVDEKMLKGFATCHQHTVGIVSTLGDAKLLFIFHIVVKNSIKRVEILPLQAKYKATLVLNLTSHFFLS